MPDFQYGIIRSMVEQSR